MIKLKQLLESVKARDDGGLEINSINSISNDQWETISTFMNQKGYGMRGGPDAKHSVSKFLSRGNGVLILDNDFISDWIEAIKLATGISKKSTKSIIDIKKIFSTAKRKLGTTDRLELAGYILPDGSLINLSHEGMTRGLDHREIVRVFDALGIKIPSATGSATPYMEAFVRMGAIRIDGDHSAVDIGRSPTYKQEEILGIIFSRNDGEIILDLYDKNYGKTSRNYNEGTRPERILNDIRVFYERGILPKQQEFREIKKPH